LNKFDEGQLRFDLEGFDELIEDAEERAISFEEARKISEAARLTFELRSKQVGEAKEHGFAPTELTNWWGDYLKLILQGWSWRVACYIAWAASPRKFRSPENLEGLATMLGLRSPRAIHTWKSKYPTISHMVALMQVAPLWEHRRDVLDALVEMASLPDYKSFNDRKLYLEMVGDYIPKSKLELGKAAKGEEGEMSDGELREWLGENVEHEKGEVKITKDAKDLENKEGRSDKSASPIQEGE
jgi:hypothetical protein